jgi:hypothetical protein
MNAGIEFLPVLVGRAARRVCTRDGTTIIPPQVRDKVPVSHRRWR